MDIVEIAEAQELGQPHWASSEVSLGVETNELQTSSKSLPSAQKTSALYPFHVLLELNNGL